VSKVAWNVTISDGACVGIEELIVMFPPGAGVALTKPILPFGAVGVGVGGCVEVVAFEALLFEDESVGFVGPLQVATTAIALMPTSPVMKPGRRMLASDRVLRVDYHPSSGRETSGVSAAIFMPEFAERMFGFPNEMRVACQRSDGIMREPVTGVRERAISRLRHVSPAGMCAGGAELAYIRRVDSAVT
jgi:hypothetical protein